MADTSTTSFDQLGLEPSIVEAIKQIGYEAPTQIQAASIPVLLKGQDLLGQAQTGTGKTAAFALPLLSNLDWFNRQPQVLVLTPTRELAIQVSEAFQSYARGIEGFRGVPIYGGQSMSNQLRQLKAGAHVIVGTPGRVMDHLRRKSLRLDNIQTIVLDEADEMLKMGFIEDIEWILEQAHPEKQVALFSATMPDAIRRIARKHLKNAEEIKIKTRTTTVESIEQLYWYVQGVHKLDALTRFLEVQETDAIIIFVRTKTATVELAEKLEARGHSCAALNGDLSQDVRERTIEKLKKGEIDIIVATDVAARGIDVERVSHVVNYDIPHDPEAYVHRIGRTGRAGRSGTAILFVSPRETRLLKSIERTTRQPIKELSLPSKQDVTERRVQRFKEQLGSVIGQDLGMYKQIVEEVAAERDISTTEVAAALCYIAQQENPFVLQEARPPKEKRSKQGSSDVTHQTHGRRRRHDRGGMEEGMERYRIAVGREQGANAGNIVGAIAGASGLQGKYIGHIKLHDDFSLVDLPTGMPAEVLRGLQNVKINSTPLQIQLESQAAGRRTVEKERTRERPDRNKGRKQPAVKKGGSKKKKSAHRRKDSGRKASLQH